MAQKKTIKKQNSDFYSEGTSFSDDPEDSFYATGDNDGSQEKGSSKVESKQKIAGFYIWELMIILGEAILLSYLIVVLFGLLPLY